MELYNITIFQIALDSILTLGFIIELQNLMKEMVTAMTTMIARKIAAVGFVSAVLLVGGCSADVGSNPPVSETNSVSEEDNRYSEDIFEDVTMETDIVYANKKDYRLNDTDLKLDLYQPVDDTAENRPVIIWVHGGGMFTGSKNESWEPVCFLASDFAKKGYVCISIDYRLNPEWKQTGAFNETMKNAAQDVASAVDWVRENSAKYRMDSGRIILAGYSSGAEIVDNYYFSNFLTDEKTYDKSGIKAVISISGNRLFYDNAACSGDSDVKCLILHGEVDDINPMSDAQIFLTQLGDRGVMKVLPENGHFWTETAAQKSFLLDSITEFLLDEVTNGKQVQ
ncbi:MAG: alpha/beta hydrolase [Oscillospiraceae bacterium]